MGFLIMPNLSPSILQLKEKQKPPIIHFSPLSSTASTSKTTSGSGSGSATILSPQIKLEPPFLLRVAQLHQTSIAQDKQQRDDFYLNLGLAVRTLREDLPLVFTKDLNYHIYRDDVTFLDPLNTFNGIEKYKLIFWALRIHGRVLFREISLEVFRVWQPSENVILIRWNLRGVPRVPWEAKGQFQGTSRYKLDRNGKIYEHRVDNLAFNFPQRLKPSSAAASVLDLVAASACPASPNPTFLWLWGPPPPYSYSSSSSSSWVEFYWAVRETLDQECDYLTTSQDCLAPCS